MKLFNKRKKQVFYGDDILVDAQNISQLNSQQFEGVIERPIQKKSFTILSIGIFIVCFLFVIRLFFVQLVQGSHYRRIADNNYVEMNPLFPSRGVILDRNGKKLAWNTSEEGLPYLRRTYQDVPGLSHLLGFIRYPKSDKKGIYWRTDTEGVGGLEQLLNARLKGVTGYELIPERKQGEDGQEANVVVRPVSGQNITLTIDSELQSLLGQELQIFMNKFNFEAGGAVVMDVHTGEIRALVSLPDFDANRVTSGDSDYLASLSLNKKNPFLNRVTSGLFTPGSIVKPFVALEALEEGVITEQTTVYSSGKIEIPNPYDPSKPTYFKDWKPEGHGVVNIKSAIADSVNTFFYAIGGGYRGQKGIGISGIEKAVRRFGFGQPVEFTLPAKPSGTVPSPSWKQKTFKEKWRLGDTYITAIGQYGFQVSPLQMVRAVGALANGGILIEPRILSTDQLIQKKITDISAQNYQVVYKGMRMTVTDGTAQFLDIPGYEVAAKTGSAQVGIKKDKMNSWIIGFYPASKPQYAFALLAEKGPAKGSPNVGWVLRSVFEKLSKDKETSQKIPQLSPEPDLEILTNW